MSLATLDLRDEVDATKLYRFPKSDQLLLVVIRRFASNEPRLV
jgi:hypothetical protein